MPGGAVINKNTLTVIALALVAMVVGGSAVQAGTVTDASKPTSSDALYGVSCTGWRQCMAVGSRAVGTGANIRPLAESWDGVKWRAVPMPGPAVSARAQVSQVSCRSKGDCVAVGYYVGPDSRDTVNLAEEWNGTSWRIILPIKPAYARSAFLNDVSCSNSAGCIAVGGYAGPSGNGRALAELWVRGRWQLLPVPVPPGARASELNGISCGSRHCMAVGAYKDASGHILTLAARLSGSSWRLLRPANSSQPITVLDNVSCQAATQCMAVGFFYGSRQVPFTELWAHGRWRPRPAGGLAAGVLTGISCPGPARCIAVGSAAGKPVAITWAGARWRVVRAAGASGRQASELNQLSCRTQTIRCIAVGAWYKPGTLAGRLALASAWNGRTWESMAAPNP